MGAKQSTVEVPFDSHDLSAILSPSLAKGEQLSVNPQGPGVISAALFTPALSKYLLQIAAAHAGKSFGTEGLQLLEKPFRMQDMFDAFAHAMTVSFLEPAYPAMEFRCKAAFLVEYREGAAASHDLHEDDSDVTVNFCLGRRFSGGDLCVADNPDLARLVLARSRLVMEKSGTRGVPLPPVMPDSMFRRYPHHVGSALVHSGHAMHGAEPLKGGHRINLIVWLRIEPKLQPSLPLPQGPALLTVLPTEILETVLAQLEPFDLAAVSAVCRKMRELSLGNDVWRAAWETTPPIPPPPPRPTARTRGLIYFDDDPPIAQVPVPARLDTEAPGDVRAAWIEARKRHRMHVAMSGSLGHQLMEKRLMPSTQGELLKEWHHDLQRVAEAVLHSEAVCTLTPVRQRRTYDKLFPAVAASPSAPEVEAATAAYVRACTEAIAQSPEWKAMAAESGLPEDRKLRR
jgi:hypothetical protein